MPLMLGLSSVLIVVLTGTLALAAVYRLDSWPRRRELQFLVLAAPVVALGVIAGGLHHLSGRVCYLEAPPWDERLGFILPVGMMLTTLGAVALGTVRMVLMHRVVIRRGIAATSRVQRQVDALAHRMGTKKVRVLLCPLNRPLALTCGVVCSTIVISTWMLEHLDDQELHTVLAHELGHVTRRDYLMVWVATVLRDAFFYVPTSWIAYRQIQREKELASDDLAVAATHLPLAMASALAKVWHHALGGVTYGAAQSLVGAGVPIENRIQRLLAYPTASERMPTSGRVLIGMAMAAIVSLIGIEALTLAQMLAPMGCGPLPVLTALSLWPQGYR